MTADQLDDAALAELLRGIRRVAMVGASNRPDRPSHGVMRFLLDRGIEVVPVNPVLAGQTIHGALVVARLEALPEGSIDLVDVFRASDQVGPVADAAILIHARVLWLQLGVTNPAAEAKARAAGIIVVADRCPVIEWQRLGLPMDAPPPR